MSIVRRRRIRGGVDYWPGFVDALSTLVLAIVFLLTVFVVAQFFLSQQVSDKDTVLSRLNRQLAELTDLLALERANSRNLQDRIDLLGATLQAAEAERNRLSGLVGSEQSASAASGARIGALTRDLDAERKLSAEALSQVEALNQQLLALRRQLAALEQALEAAEAKDRDAQVRLADLGQRLNVALAQKVQELARYRSDFFGRLRQILGNRPDIRIVGDRFVFQSELFFDRGRAELTPEGRAELDKLVPALLALEREIPPDIAWVLRVDGHTDRRPLSGFGQFRSNWDLSAARAIAVVQALADKGVPPNRLLAAGFGEFQPLELGEGEEAYRRNRRIELKLTER